MNTCCCRSNRDRYDPLACIPALPRLIPVQNCRPFLEGRKATSCCLSRERRWGQLNSGMIGVLAKIVNKSADKVCQFLHHLTLNLFARILYPLAAGWNTLKIPFVLSDTCELYYGIYDEDGNLRNPMPTRTLLVLVTMLQYFLNLPMNHGKDCGRKKKGCCCQDMENDLKNIHNSGYCGKGAMILFGGTRPPKIEISAAKEIWAGLRRVGYDQFSTLRDIPSNDSLPYGYAPYRCPCQASDPRGSLALQSRRAIVRPFADLPEPLKALALQNACEAEEKQLELYDPKPKAEAPIKGSWVKVQRIYITRISNLYAAVVQNQHHRQLVGDGQKPQPRTQHRIVPCQRFSGGCMSEPYFNGRPWSCLNRDPNKTMVLRKGGFQIHIPNRPRPFHEDVRKIQLKVRELDKMEVTLRPLENINLVKKRLTLARLSWQSRLQTIERPLKQNLPALLAPPPPPAMPGRIQIQELEPYRPASPARIHKPSVDFWEELKEREHLAKMRHPLETSPWKHLRSYFSLSNSQGSTYGSSMKSESSLTSKSTYKFSNPDIENKDTSSGIVRETGGESISPTSQKRTIKAIEPKPTFPFRKPLKNTEKPIYPEPEDYRREMARKLSRTKRLQNRIPGESYLLVKQAVSLKQKPGVHPINQNIPPSKPIIKTEPLKGQNKADQGPKKVRFGVPLVSKKPTPDSEKTKMRVWRRTGDQIKSIIKSEPTAIEKVPERIFLKKRLCSSQYENPSPSKAKHLKSPERSKVKSEPKDHKNKK
ncbi:uncharacterized protein [Drosophila bipectinata]|uniref:uncharacterized protein n=1 Tax=Drosophila bipectinata TaxID=42026 RepID=UPI0038B22FBC